MFPKFMRISFLCVCLWGVCLGRLWRAFGAQREQPPEKRDGPERSTEQPNPYTRAAKGKGTKRTQSNPSVSKTEKGRRTARKLASAWLTARKLSDIAILVVANEGELATGDDDEAAGKRKHRPNQQYAAFWRHANDRDDDLDVPGLQ
ncbi:hypothetical protein K438DRAFT_1782998 [Mycena galopus ATCC 62051]|nr:hypothetical protein K438DRAFT_1782998 [Mycena galopus ATCC 62051]